MYFQGKLLREQTYIDDHITHDNKKHNSKSTTKEKSSSDTWPPPQGHSPPFLSSLFPSSPVINLPPLAPPHHQRRHEANCGCQGNERLSRSCMEVPSGDNEIACWWSWLCGGGRVWLLNMVVVRVYTSLINDLGSMPKFGYKEKLRMIIFFFSKQRNSSFKSTSLYYIVLSQLLN